MALDHLGSMMSVLCWEMLKCPAGQMAVEVDQ